MEHLQEISHLNMLHWLLAYAGLVVHILMKFSETEGTLKKSLDRKMVLTTCASIILIPIILIVCSTEPFLKETLPINNLTAFLAGYQTQSFARSITKLTKQKNQKNESDENESDGAEGS